MLNFARSNCWKEREKEEKIKRKTADGIRDHSDTRRTTTGKNESR